MRRNVIAGALIALGLGLMGTAVSGLGVSNPPVTAPASPSPRINAAPMAAHHQDPVGLAGIQSLSTRVDPNAAVAFLAIPRLSVKAPVYQRGVDARGNMLIAHGYSVTQFVYSSAIGAGNTVLYGHDDIEGSVFAHLQDLAPGDTIVVTLARSGESTIWRVTGKAIVPATDVAILNPTHDVRLTVFTCWPTWIDTRRVVITAVEA